MPDSNPNPLVRDRLRMLSGEASLSTDVSRGVLGGWAMAAARSLSHSNSDATDIGIDPALLCGVAAGVGVPGELVRWG